jgi:hypothetical protein
MDPLSGSLTFATIVQLVGLFRQERRDQKTLTFEEFTEWLEGFFKSHLEESSTEIKEAIDLALHADRDVLLNKMSQVEKVVLYIYARMDEFSNVVQAFDPGRGLSDQAVTIVQEFVNSNARGLAKKGYDQDSILMLLPGGQIKVSEQRLLNDDLETLCELGFLRIQNIGQYGDVFYDLTRHGVEFVHALESHEQ